MSWNLALEINKLVSITRVSGSSILIYNSTGTLLASYATTGLFLGDASVGSGSAGSNKLTLPSYGSLTWAGITATPPSILTGGGANIFTRAGIAFNQNYAGTEKGQTDFALYSQVVTGSVPSVVPLTSNSPIYTINTNSSSTNFRLPAVTSGVTPVGTFFIFNNNGGASATIANVSAVTLHTCAVGATVKAILIDNTTAPDGTWEMTSELPNTVNWGTSGVTFSGDLNATNLNGKLGIVGGTSNSGNIIFCNNTTSTTGNFDLLTDSNQHLKFAGGSNLLTIGGATNGGISIPSTAGTLTMATTGSILCNNLKNIGSGENLNLTAFTSGVASALTFNATSSNNTSASGMYGYISSAGWHFLSGDTTAETLAGINKYGFFINNCGYFIRGDKFNSLTSTSYWNTNDMVIWNNASSVLAIANSIISFGLKGASNTTFNFHSTAPSNYFNIQCQGGGATAYLYVMSQPANTGVQLTTSAPNGWVSTSDRRLKKNVEDIPDALSSLLKLRPVSFDFISNPDGRKCVGFVAQEIQEIPLFDYLVMDTGRTGENEDTPYLGIAITDFIPYSVKAIQEQNKLIVSQQAELTDLKAQLASLKATVDALVAQKEILVV
jgi:hypothetical protein